MFSHPEVITRVVALSLAISISLTLFMFVLIRWVQKRCRLQDQGRRSKSSIRQAKPFLLQSRSVNPTGANPPEHKVDVKVEVKIQVEEGEEGEDKYRQSKTSIPIHFDFKRWKKRHTATRVPINFNFSHWNKRHGHGTSGRDRDPLVSCLDIEAGLSVSIPEKAHTHPHCHGSEVNNDSRSESPVTLPPPYESVKVILPSRGHQGFGRKLC